MSPYGGQGLRFLVVGMGVGVDISCLVSHPIIALDVLACTVVVYVLSW